VKKVFIIAIILSQILFLRVFSNENSSLFVLNEEKKLCWIFEKWTKDNPNWLQEGWYALILSDSKLEGFVKTTECGSGIVSGCCKSLGYKYAWVPIGERYISKNRSALDNDFIEWLQGFRPNDRVTKTEALKLIFKAKNIEKSYNTSYWQEDYISTAYYKGYIDEKFKNYNETASRWWIFLTASRTFTEFTNY